MVLSWRARTEATSTRIFNGEGDVKQFIFYYENVVLRNETGEERSTELHSHLDGTAFEFYFDTFLRMVNFILKLNTSSF